MCATAARSPIMVMTPIPTPPFSPIETGGLGGAGGSRERPSTGGVRVASTTPRRAVVELGNLCAAPPPPPEPAGGGSTSSSRGAPSRPRSSPYSRPGSSPSSALSKTVGTRSFCGNRLPANPVSFPFSLSDKVKLSDTLK